MQREANFGGQPLRAAAWGLALVVLTGVAYWPATQAGFVWDDDANVTGNVALRSVQGLIDLWIRPGTTTQYYPLVYTSLWLEYALWGLAPFGYHVDNILLHAGSAWLLWRLLARLGLPGAWLAAAVFALHPVHVESVAWVTERKNTLSAIFYLAAAYVYLSRVTDAFLEPGRDTARRGRTLALLLCLLLFVCALLSKSPTATLPAALLVVVWWKKGRIDRADWLPTLPMIALVVPVAGLTISMEKKVGTVLGLDWDPSVVERFLLAGRAGLFYAAKLVWPSSLAFVYPRWHVDDGEAWQYLFPLAALSLCGLLFALRHRVGRGPLAALLYFAGTLAPVLGFLEIYFFRFSFVADHWQYLASVGLIALAVCGSHQLMLGVRSPRALPLLRAAWCLAIVVLGSLTYRQSQAYVDSETLWRDSLSKNADAPMVHYNLAFELEAAGRAEAAVDHYRRAIALAPHNPNAYNNLGMIHATAGRNGEAIELLREAVAKDPGFARGHWNLGMILARVGRLNEATAHLEQAIVSSNGDGSVAPETRAASHVQLGQLLLRTGRVRPARQHFEQALEIDPASRPAHLQLGRLALRARRPERARGHFLAVLAREPGQPAALEGLRRCAAMAGGRLEPRAAFDARTDARTEARTSTPGIATAPREPRTR